MSLIHVAAFYDSIECLQYLIKKGQSPTLKSGFGFSPLHYAIYGFAQETVVYLLSECNADPNECPEGTGFTPIYLSVFQKSAVILNILFDFGAICDGSKMMSDKGIKSPIMTALNSVNYEAFKTLLERSRIDSSKDEAQYSTLMKAISSHVFNAVEPLIELGVDVNYSTRDGKTALYLAIISKSLETVNLLISYGANVNQKNA